MAPKYPLHYSVLEKQPVADSQPTTTTATPESNTDYTLEQQRRDSTVRILLITFFILFPGGFFIGEILRLFYFPNYPSFTVVVAPASAEHNVTADVIELGVAVDNRNNNFMSLRDVKLTTIQSGKKRRLSATVTYPPFENKGQSWLYRITGWLRLDNVTLSVDTDGISKLSATIWATVRYRKKVWPFMQESSMRAQCDWNVGNSNSGTNLFTAWKTAIDCQSYGIEVTYPKLMLLGALCGYGVITMSLTFYIIRLYKRDSVEVV